MKWTECSWVPRECRNHETAYREPTGLVCWLSSCYNDPVQVLPHKRNKMKWQSRETPLKSVYCPFTEINMKRISFLIKYTFWRIRENVEGISKWQALPVLIVYAALHSFYFLIFSYFFYLVGGEGTCAIEHLWQTTCWSCPLPPCRSKAGSSDLAASLYLLSHPVSPNYSFYEILLLHFCICVHVLWCESGGLRTAVGLSSLLPPWESQGSSSDHQAWRQAPLPCWAILLALKKDREGQKIFFKFVTG